ncbi:MAG: hypothetical protein KBD47_00390 [Candidatus Pacebacteria bacterium]|nr:hypothetical protein [Candidatus Paceibacterota bacterium]
MNKTNKLLIIYTTWLTPFGLVISFTPLILLALGFELFRIELVIGTVLALCSLLIGIYVLIKSRTKNKNNNDSIILSISSIILIAIVPYILIKIIMGF